MSTHIEPASVLDFAKLGSGLFLRGLLPLYVLNLLADHPCHGAAVSQRIAEMTKSEWTPSPGSLYPLLHRLEALGAVTEDVAEDRGRLVRVYRITDAGREVLAELRQVVRPQLEATMRLLAVHLENL